MAIAFVGSGVDDAHWADSATLSLLRHLARRTVKTLPATSLRLLIVLTYREIQLDEARAFYDVLTDFDHERLATRLKLTRLDDESDIRAVFSGVSGASELRNVLAKLDTRQQALILGHAVPMLVVVRTRDTTSAAYYEALGYSEGDQLQKKLEKNRRALGRDDSGL